MIDEGELKEGLEEFYITLLKMMSFAFDLVTYSLAAVYPFTALPSLHQTLDTLHS